jgi:two-component system chemotaxis response regulator CheB
MQRRDIIVIGSSRGGVEPLTQLVERLSPDLRASVFIVRHIPVDGHNYLVDILSKITSLSVVSAAHCEAIRKSRIYIAPANHHLLINMTQTYLSCGPQENLCRPAIDPLFRSAAVAYGPRVLGIVLSGELDDGTAGLLAIKECGGIAIAQDPANAASPSMPRSAADYVALDYSLPASDIGVLLNELVKETVPATFECPRERIEELDLLTGKTEGVQVMEGKGSLIPVGCPSCGGPLWQLNGEFPRYRCHLGHAYSGQSIAQGLKEAEEQALYAALRSLEERVRMLKRLVNTRKGQMYMEKMRDAEVHAQQLRDLLFSQEGEKWKCS